MLATTREPPASLNRRSAHTNPARERRRTLRLVMHARFLSARQRALHTASSGTLLQLTKDPGCLLSKISLNTRSKSPLVRLTYVSSIPLVHQSPLQLHENSPPFQKSTTRNTNLLENEFKAMFPRSTRSGGSGCAVLKRKRVRIKRTWTDTYHIGARTRASNH